MCAFELLLSVDPSLGRVDYSLMSDQTLMEMLIEGFGDETKKDYKDGEGMYLDVCEWSGIKCDDNERVIEIDIVKDDLSGSLELCYFPPKVNMVTISPRSKSNMTGSVDLTQLPEGLQVLDLRNNNLTGEIDLTQLPDRMNFLNLSNNQLTGEINLKQLPSCMRELHLNNNHLTGEIDLTRLPDGMTELSLEKNRFSGSFIVKRFPPEITTINALGSQFNAVAVVHSKTRAIINLKGSGVTSVVDENGNNRDMKRFLM